MTATPRACRGFKFSRFGITHAVMPLDAFDYEGAEAGWFSKHQREEVNMYLVTDTRVQIALAVFVALAVLIGVADPSEAARFKAH